MTRNWEPAPGWSGAWSLPDRLLRPVNEAQRGALVAMSFHGLGPQRLAARIKDAPSLDEAVADYIDKGDVALAKIAAAGVRALVPSDPEYPALLRDISAAPTLLFVRGRPLDELQPAVAIVGARACTAGAARFAHRLGEAISGAGFAVVSGLARGIDGAAHGGALERGRTIGVLGTGLDIVYPAEHRDLAKEIAQSGALVSEFPLGIGPRAWHFPARNRVIAGLAIAVIVVEAGTSSGALITVNFAVDHGREVFACVTGPENPAGEGVRKLLLEGANIVITADHAVEQLVELARAQGYDIERAATTAMRKNVELSGDLRSVYEAISEDTTLQEIVSVTTLDARRASALLTELELSGLVSAEHGRWRRH